MTRNRRARHAGGLGPQRPGEGEPVWDRGGGAVPYHPALLPRDAHIGSTIRGELRGGQGRPGRRGGGSPGGDPLSGAPKIRACQRIGQLEGNKRGIYGGAIGYLDFTGNLDTCIAIRIAYQKNGRVFVRSGAGIVADSVPETEYEECLNKAKAVMRALSWPRRWNHDLAHIDSHDSFSYNLYQLVGALNPDIQVIRNDEKTVAEIRAMAPSHILLSPGPRPAGGGGGPDGRGAGIGARSPSWGVPGAPGHLRGPGAPSPTPAS